MAVNTIVEGNWIAIIGTAEEVVEELNRLNILPERIVSGGNNGGEITLFVGQQ